MKRNNKNTTNYRVTVNNYKDDKYYPKVVCAVEEILEKNSIITSVGVMQNIGVLSEESYNKWKEGKIRYLELVISCNLSKVNRILTILGFHAHDLNMGKTIKFVKFRRKILHFTKNRYKKGEELYARQFHIIGRE